MKLTEVLTFLESCTLQDMHLDSRRIKPGDLFVAVPGLATDGREYIAQAVAQGAAALLIEEPYSGALPANVPAYIIPNLKDHLAQLAAHFYHEPSTKLKVIGVTGTNGKTSTTHYIAQLLAAHNLQCGIMGTLGHGVWPDLTPSALTTSDCCTVQQNFAQFAQRHVPYVAMEVSSHALNQGRLLGTKLDTAVFTNLSQDHLDYHADMQDYFAAKQRLFCDFAPKHRIVNFDDAYGTQLPASLTYSIQDPRADLYSDGKLIYTPWGKGTLDSPLLGSFNLSNLLAVIACCAVQGLSLDSILAAVPRLVAVPGRMQTVLPPNDQLPTVIVDYAHTPDAVAKVLQTLQHHPHDQLYCIIGCGGDRDRRKRPLMLEAALKYSDQVIITMDNPRTEDPQQIVADMLQGLGNSKNLAEIEYDRALAIQKAINQAGPRDLILIAGKGHEDYQIIGTEKRPFSDLEVAKQALEH